MVEMESLLLFLSICICCKLQFEQRIFFIPLFIRISYNTLCFSSGQPYACDAMYQTEYLLYYGNGEQILVQYKHGAWDDDQAYTQVSSKNKGLYVGVSLHQLLPLEYTNSNFQPGRNFRKSTFGFVFTLGGRVVSWRSVKQSYIVDFIIEVEYITVSEATKEVFWL